mmetsp:Transcript_23443/g.76202  ORF Transcript_23443/g.76202 Transcript_23443/m.76202 type:complete len:201 (-) Transcript_23443:2012-2614(-)
MLRGGSRRRGGGGGKGGGGGRRGGGRGGGGRGRRNYISKRQATAQQATPFPRTGSHTQREEAKVAGGSQESDGDGTASLRFHLLRQQLLLVPCPSAHPPEGKDEVLWPKACFTCRRTLQYLHHPREHSRDEPVRQQQPEDPVKNARAFSLASDTQSSETAGGGRSLALIAVDGARRRLKPPAIASSSARRERTRGSSWSC